MNLPIFSFSLTFVLIFHNHCIINFQRATLLFTKASGKVVTQYLKTSVLSPSCVLSSPEGGHLIGQSQ